MTRAEVEAAKARYYGGKPMPSAPSRPRHVAGRMNKTEAKYAERLKLLEAAGEIRCWKFESVKLRLADRTWYTPDFFVMTKGGECEFHEVKGWMEDDAAVKLKVAAEMYPEFHFLVVTWDRGRQSWNFRSVQ